MRKVVFILIVLSFIVFSPAFSAGAPVFDVENWLYSILQYTQMGQDTLNFVNEVQRQIQLAERLYSAINEGDLSAALSGIAGYSNRIEQGLQRYGIQSQVYSQVTDVITSSAQWSEHLDDPDYFSSVLDELSALDQQVQIAQRDFHDSVQAQAQEDNQTINESSNSLAVPIESTTAAQNKMVVAAESQNARDANTQVTAQEQALSSTNQALIKAQKEKANFYKAKAEIVMANKSAIEAIENSIPQVDVDLSDPFAI